MERGASMGLSMVLTRRNAREGVAAKGGAGARGLWRVRQSRSLFLPQSMVLFASTGDGFAVTSNIFCWNRRRFLMQPIFDSTTLVTAAPWRIKMLEPVESYATTGKQKAGTCDAKATTKRTNCFHRRKKLEPAKSNVTTDKSKSLARALTGEAVLQTAGHTPAPTL